MALWRTPTSSLMTPAGSPCPSPANLEQPSLTLDVLPTILNHVLSCSDLFNLCLASHSFAYYARFRLYDGTLFIPPTFGSKPGDHRRYAKILRVLGCHPELASRVRVFVVPYMEIPHERFDDLWEHAFAHCVNIEEFRWRSCLPIPASILRGLSARARLRVLSIPADNLSTTSSVRSLAEIHPLEELTILAPDRPFAAVLVDWVNSMGDTLQRLHIESAAWLDDSLFEQLRLPRLKVLTLHDCPHITSSGILPLLRTTPRLELLYLGLSSVKIADLARPEDRLPPPSLPNLRKVSLNWERSLAFWIHVQTLLASSPVETFHIIRSSVNTDHPVSMVNRGGTVHSTAMASTTLAAPDAVLADNLGTAFGLGVPYNPFVGGQRHHHAHHPHQHQQQAQNQAQAQVHPPPNINANITPASTTVINRFFNLNASGSTTNAHVNHALSNQATVDDAFIHRFITLHHSTLRKFWVVGMRCSEDAIRELCERCERLERVRAEDVDEFPLIGRPLRIDRDKSAKAVWWWWARRRESIPAPAQEDS